MDDLTIPSKEQLEAMAREYARVKPIEEAPQDGGCQRELCRALATVQAHLELFRTPSAAVQGLVGDAKGAVRILANLLCDAYPRCEMHAVEVTPPRGYTVLLQNALLSSAAFCRLLYEREETKGAVLNTALYLHSILTTMTAF